MSWRHIYQILDQACDEVCRQMAKRPEAIPSPAAALKAQFGMLGATVAEIAQKQQALAGEIDQACRYYAEHLRWPLMSQEVASCALTRLIAGRQFAKFVARPSLPSSLPLPDFESMGLCPRMLSWVLVDWRAYDDEG